MAQPLACYTCKNVRLMPLQLFADDGSGPCDHDTAFFCFGCKSICLTVQEVQDLGLPVRDPTVSYQWFSNVSSLTVLRMVQPKLVSAQM